MALFRGIWAQPTAQTQTDADMFFNDDDSGLLAEMEQIHQIMQARKERYETTYVKVNQELVKKHRELSHLHQEFDWLRVECKKLKAQSQLITGEQERQSQNIDNLIQLIIGEDLSEVSSCIPRIRAQYSELRSIADTDQLLTDITQTRKMLDKFEFLTKSSQARFRRTEAGIGNNSHYSMRRLTSEEAMKLYLIKLRKELEAKIAIKVNERLSSANRNRGANLTASNKENNDTPEPVEDEDLRNHDTSQPRQGILRTNTTNTRPAGGRYSDALMRTLLASPMNQLSSEPQADGGVQMNDDLEADPDSDFTVYDEPHSFIKHNKS